MNNELKHIIDQSYQIFSAYKVSLTLDVCKECCVTMEEELKLATTAVNKIPFELLYTYHTAAKPQKININEFKHFAPRYLDLTANMKFVSHSVELVLQTFGEINDWTTKETELLHSFGKEFFVHCLKAHPLPENEAINSILIMLDNGNFEIADYLSDWKNVNSIESVLHFSDLINYGFKDKKPDQLSSAFAEKKTSKTIFDWINRADISALFKQRIENLILNPDGISDKDQIELSLAYECLVRFAHR
ncbi:MAG: hypothetical protein GQ574_24455 [Crocinitomix sp.]|nr:hypothetical protein [Crocinitomix sp.]